MKDKIKCDDSIDCGTTRIRGWHNYKDCPHPAKYKVTFKDGSVKMLCGVHKNKSASEVCCISSFPQDYNFAGQSPQYICGMSVPPVMMAQVASRIYDYWLSKI